jgi:hypothetical protein
VNEDSRTSPLRITQLECVGVEKVESGIVRSGIKELSYPEWRCPLTVNEVYAEENGIFMIILYNSITDMGELR